MSQIDILSIDIKIKEEFKKEYSNLNSYKNKLSDLQKTSIKKNLSSRNRKNIEKNISELQEKISSIYSKYNLHFYIAETANLIEKYKKILNTPIKISFIGRDTRDNKEKNEIIIKYLSIAQKYTSQNLELPSKNKRVICNNCYNKKTFHIIDDSIYICLQCGSQQEILLNTSSYKDVDRINITSKYTYDRKVHFRDCINQYQGKQNSTIDDKVIKNLTRQFSLHHLLIGDDQTPKEIRFSKITKEHIHIFLKELEYTKHYENVNLIHYQMTGKKPDDISYLEDRLLDDFDALTELYDKEFKNKMDFLRKSFINTQYVLYQLLSRYNHPCKKEDFTVLKTIDRIAFHDNIAKKCFEELGWNHTPLF